MIKRTYIYVFIILLNLVLLTTLSRSQVTTPAGSSVVFGKWDGTNAEADQPGEVTFGLSGVYTGVPVDSLTAADTIIIDSAHAFSSLESLLVNDQFGMANNDTVFFLYYFQNQGNLTDSFFIEATLIDTSNALYFTPTDFDMVASDSSTVLSTSVSVDTISYGKLLAQDALDSFLVRVVIAAGTDAKDGDSLLFQVNILDNSGTGINDAWPDTVTGGYVRKIVIDTMNTLLHSHGDTLWEYGDNQITTNFLTVNSSQMYINATVNKATTAPGDTLIYTIFYDNDGSAQTLGSVTMQQLLPLYVLYDSTSAAGSYHSGESGTQIDFSAYAAPSTFDKNSTWANANPDSVAGIKWTLMTSIGADNSNDTLGLADTLAADTDAGNVSFKVIVK